MFVYPDAEGLVISYLNSRLDASVSTKFREGRHVRVSRAGGPEMNRVMDQPMLTIGCYDDSTVSAAGLAQTTRALLKESPQHVDFIRGYSETGGPMSFPDPDTALPRYQFTIQLQVKGSKEEP